MFSLKKMLYFASLNMSFTEVLVLMILNCLPQPINLVDILKISSLKLKERQLRNIVSKLEQAGFFIRFKYKNKIILAFPFITKSKRGCNILPHRPCDKLVKNNKLHATYCTQDYIYSKYLYKRNYVISNNNINIIEEEIMSKQQKVVFNQNNPYILKLLKEKFEKDFPTKNSYVNCPVPSNFNYNLLKKKILSSPFLKEKDNLGFSWFLSHYDSVISDYYKPFSLATKPPPDNGFKERTYSTDYLNSLFDL